MIVYAMRHGQTNYNLLGLCNDNPERDVHLTGEGISQARRAAEQLKTVPLERILVSSLPRTRETALWVNRHHCVPIEVDAGLNDIRSGFDGLPVTDYFAAIATDRLNGAVNGGESVLEHKQRIMDFIERLRARTEACLLIVAHEETMRVFMAVFSGLSDEEMIGLNIGNCEVYRFAWSA